MTTLARDLMHSNVTTVRESSSLLEVVHLLVRLNVSGAPVVDAAGAVVGVVSATDVLQALDQALDQDRDEGEPEEPLELVRTLEVGELATPDVVFVSPDAPATEVARVMRVEGIHRVLVGTRERLEGIITAFDVLDNGTPRRRASDAFNDSRLSRFLNSGRGRLFRLIAGFGFVALGARFHDRALGVAALVWSLFPLSAGALDVCYISAALGGPFSGAKIRERRRA